VTELLDDHERTRADDRDDGVFYAQPRLVHHVDREFRERLTELYADHLAPGDDVLDLMSSWVSHLPDINLGRVVGHGMNREELEQNSRLDDYALRDLNDDQSLPFEDGAFDAVLCAVSVQYLQYPGPVFSEVRRVLRPAGVCIVSFSNRMFPTKAIRAWRVRSMDERALLVSRYVEEAGVGKPTVVREPARDGDPFYAVVAERPDGER
jgi:ubiquinone/menaquinone biosynthesis C-methylase UbiE